MGSFVTNVPKTYDLTPDNWFTKKFGRWVLYRSDGRKITVTDKRFRAIAKAGKLTCFDKPVSPDVAMALYHKRPIIKDDE